MLPESSSNSTSLQSLGGGGERDLLVMVGAGARGTVSAGVATRLTLPAIPLADGAPVR